MRRREFLTVVSAGIAVWPIRALAQLSEKTWRMGFISQGYEKFYDALFEGLREIDWRTGHKCQLAISHRGADTASDRNKHK